jgi:hypothetical protein
MATAGSPTRQCGEDGCGRPLRARGLCSTHYNRQQYTPGERHRKTPRSCATCGEAYLSSRATGRYCSLLCRDFDTWGPLLTPVPLRHPARGWTPRMPSPPFTPTRRACAECGASFTAHTRDHRFCTRVCKRRAIAIRRKARVNGTFGTYTWTQVIGLFLLFDRCCAYCDQPIDGQPDPDHVVPLSRGGDNTIGNILPACRTCNGDKRDLLPAEWNPDRARRGLPPRRTTWDRRDVRFAHLTPQPTRCAA